MAHAAYFKIYAETEDGKTFLLGETLAKDGQPFTAKQNMAAENGKTLTAFFTDISQGFGVKSLVAKKEPCLCTECTK